MTCLSLTLRKSFETFQKNVSIPRMDEKKLHTLEFPMKIISRSMRCNFLQKGQAEKQQGVPNTCDISPLKKIVFQNLTDAFFKYL